MLSASKLLCRSALSNRHTSARRFLRSSARPVVSAFASKDEPRKALPVAFAFLFGTASAVALCQSVSIEDLDQKEAPELDLETLPEYTSEQVAEHNGKSGATVWMSYGGIVYDVTGFIANHPGGSEKIVEASGSVSQLAFFATDRSSVHGAPVRFFLKTRCC